MSDSRQSSPSVRFTGSCTECGEQQLLPRELVVVLDDTDAGTSYRFTCPECGEERQVAASAPTAELLQTLDVEILAPARGPAEISDDAIR